MGSCLIASGCIRNYICKCYKLFLRELFIHKFMSQRNAQLSESVVRAAEHKMNSLSEITAAENIKRETISTVSDVDYCDGIPQHSRTNSIFDDSGFSSSASEDRDEVVDNTLKQQHCCSGEAGVEKKIDITKNNTQNSISDRPGVHSKLTTSGSKAQGCGNVPSKINIANKASCKERHGSPFVNRMHRSVSLGNIVGTVSSRNSGGSSRRQKTSNTVSSVVSAQTRPALNRLTRSRDVNNNECGHMNFASYLKNPPFKLQDYFQGQGLLSLAACITYTLALMMVFCVIGVIIDFIKSFVGTKNLKEIRQNIVHSRRPRTTMSCG